MAVSIAIESPLQDEVRQLIAALNAYLLSMSPPEFCYHMTVEEMAEASTTVWIARADGKAVGCGAIRRHGKEIAEVKRMYTVPAMQGQGIGRMILDHIITKAQEEQFSELVLETGEGLFAAWAIYEKAGFTRCGPVLDYPESPFSVFYRKQLAAH